MLGGSKSRDFWNTIEPFLTNKGTICSKNTVLLENEKLITDQKEICDIFNDFYVHVAKQNW